MFGTVESGSDGRLQRRRRQAAQEVEGDEPQAAHGVLDVVAEDPEEEHVAAQVDDPAVHEHRAEERHGGGGLAAHDADAVLPLRRAPCRPASRPQCRPGWVSS